MQTANTIPSPFPGGKQLSLRYWLPRIWTQPVSDSGRSFGIYWSDADGLGCLHPQPNADELRRFYDTASYDAYMGLDSINGATKAQNRDLGLASRLMMRVAWQLDDSKPLSAMWLHGKLSETPTRVCDLGCGAGQLLRGLAALGHQVTGVDPNPVALESALRSDLRVLQGTAESLPADCPREAFGLVIMSHSLEHCLDPLLAMRNAASLVARGGLLVVEVPNHACAGFEASGPAWFHTDAGRHLWFFTQRSLGAIAREVGLHDVSFEFDGYTRQFGWLTAEQQVWDCLYGDGLTGPVATPPRPSVRSQLRMLLRGLSSGPERRYDAVRLIAQKP